MRTAGDGDATRLDLEAFATVDEMAASLSPDDVRRLGAWASNRTARRNNDAMVMEHAREVLAEMDKKLFAKGQRRRGLGDAARLGEDEGGGAEEAAAGRSSNSSRRRWTPPRDRWRRRRR